MRPNKRLGQHFLRDANITRKIVDSVRAGANDQVVEIGPGLGALTADLLARFDNLIAIEVDDRAVSHLQSTYPSLDVRHQDVLAIDWSELCGERDALYVVGNLPYNITTPILFSLLDAEAPVTEIVVMMQLEVARRLVAVPRTKDYGILSVATQLAGKPQILFRVSRNVFDPKPAVESAVVRINMFGRDEAIEGRAARSVIRAAFNQRRKTLRNSLAKLLTGGHPLPEKWSGKRAEELVPSEFVELAQFVKRVEGT